MLFNDVYRDKKILVTGHAGFKGGWLVLFLKALGAKVYGYSLKPDTSESFYDIIKISHLLDGEAIADIRDQEKLKKFFNQTQPDIVMHLAAQPLVRLSYIEPVLTYQTNVIGTLNVLDAARQCPSVRAVVNVTTDKCYENQEKNTGYHEDEPMGGYDMYSSSKGCSEILSSSYRRSFLTDGKPYALGTGRAGNVIGGGDWAKDRLIPDCIKSLRDGKTIFIRNPLATRPWQHVLEPLTGYLRLGELLLTKGAYYAQGYNFGPYPDSVVKVCDVARQVAAEWGGGNVEVGSSDGLHEATLLQLDITKAERQLGVVPIYNVEEAVKITTEWYRRHYLEKADMSEFSFRQIEDFIKAAQAKNIAWSLS